MCVWGGRVGFEVLILSLVVVSCHLAVAVVKVRCVQQIKHLCSLCVYVGMCTVCMSICV